MGGRRARRWTTAAVVRQGRYWPFRQSVGRSHTGGCCVGSEGGRYWADEERLILSGGGRALDSSRTGV